MAANTFGQWFQVTSFGESHGVGLGAVVDGCPAGVQWNEELLKRELARRRPGQKQADRAVIVTDRNEGDAPEVLSGVFEGLTLGTPIAMLTRNQDQRSHDYKEIAAKPRTGHADDVWKLKFTHSDPRGGGRSSGRETVARVMAGAVAQMFLGQAVSGLRVTAFTRQAGPLSLTDAELRTFDTQVRAAKGVHALSPADDYVGRFPSAQRQDELEKLLLDAKANGKSYGGTAEVWIDGCPANLGQPVFHKLKADLAGAFMSVGATAGVELGAGLEATHAEGSQFHGGASDPDRYGGIRGGISTGERIVFRAHFKPTATVLDVAKKGRHDPCIIPRAIPVLEAMAYLVIADHLLWARGDRVHLGSAPKATV